MTGGFYVMPQVQRFRLDRQISREWPLQNLSLVKRRFMRINGMKPHLSRFSHIKLNNTLVELENAKLL